MFMLLLFESVSLDGDRSRLEVLGVDVFFFNIAIDDLDDEFDLFSLSFDSSFVVLV